MSCTVTLACKMSHTCIYLFIKQRQSNFNCRKCEESVDIYLLSCYGCSSYRRTSVFSRFSITIALFNAACQTTNMLKIHAWFVTRENKDPFPQTARRIKNQSFVTERFRGFNAHGKVSPPSGRMKNSRVSDTLC